ncbi:hypothetical protein HDU79_006254 [Rhizoclosmatium sp. JEL0117]|nr:hypothetical protein HDU79_006254 [Rhizoclosmatium sp. JEL0117]
MPPLNSQTREIPLPAPPPSRRFLSIGSDPMLAVLFANNDSSVRPQRVVEDLSASVDKLVTGFFSFTKAIFTADDAAAPSSTSSPITPTATNSSNLPDIAPDFQQLSLFVKLEDKQRTLLHAAPSPFSPTLIALLDSWGRVLIFDVQFCETCHIIKGARDAQVAWIYENGFWFLVLLLGRGVLEFWLVVRSKPKDPSSVPSSPWTRTLYTLSADTSSVLKRVCAISVGTDWTLLQSSPSKDPSKPDLSTAIIISKSTGAIKPVHLPPPSSSSTSTTPATSPALQQSNSNPATATPQFITSRQILKHVLEESLRANTPESITTLTNFILSQPDIRVQAACLHLITPNLPLTATTTLASTLATSTTPPLLTSPPTPPDTPDNNTTTTTTTADEPTFETKSHLLHNPYTTRPGLTARIDIWAFNTLYTVLQDLTQRDASSPRTSSGARTGVLRDVCDAVCVAGEERDNSAEEGDVKVLGETRHSEFVLSFEGRVVRCGCSNSSGARKRNGDVEGGNSVKLCLKEGWRSGGGVVGRVLFSGLFGGVVGMEEWRRVVGDRFRALDVVQVLVQVLEERKGWGERVVDAVYGVLEMLLGEGGGGDSSDLVQWLLDYCWKSSVIPVGYVIVHILSLLSSAKHLDLPHLDLLLTKSKDCFFLLRTIPSRLLTPPLSPALLGKTEKTSVPRFIALYQSHIPPSHESSATLSKIYTHFGTSTKTTVPIYLCRQYADIWLTSPQDTTALHKCLTSLKSITHPILRNAVILFLFHHVMSMKLRALIEMIDKNRKAPKDQACMHNLGGMDVSAVRVFLEVCSEMLGEGCLVVEEGLVGAREICGDLVDALREVSGLVSGVASGGDGGISGLHEDDVTVSAVGMGSWGVAGLDVYLDDAFAGILGRIKGPAENGLEISRELVRDHLVMIRVLLVIFQYDLKMVRPSRLFGSKVVFGRTLFGVSSSFVVGGAGGSGGMNEEEFAQVVNERALFAAKIENKELAQTVFS